MREGIFYEMFQFQTGAIKSFICGIANLENTRFNSKLVRLKGKQRCLNYH